MRVAQRRVLRRQDADVVADRHGLRLNREPGHRAVTPLRQHVVEQHRIDASDHQIPVRVHVVVVGHGANAVLAFGAQQDLVGDRAAERRHRLAAQVGQRAEPRRVARRARSALRGTRSRDRDGERRAPRRRVLDAAQADVGVAAGDRLIDRRERRR